MWTLDLDALDGTLISVDIRWERVEKLADLLACPQGPQGSLAGSLNRSLVSAGLHQKAVGCSTSMGGHSLVEGLACANLDFPVSCHTQEVRGVFERRRGASVRSPLLGSGESGKPPQHTIILQFVDVNV